MIEPGARRVREAGARRVSEAGARRVSEAGARRVSEAGARRVSDPGAQRASESAWHGPRGWLGVRGLAARVAFALLFAIAACAPKGPLSEPPSGLPAGELELSFVRVAEGGERASVPRSDEQIEVELGAATEFVLWLKAGEGIEFDEPDPVAKLERTLERRGARLSAVGEARRFAGTDEATQKPCAYWARRFRLQWFRLGKRRLPSFHFEAKRGDETLDASTPMLEFVVATVLPERADPRAEVSDELILDAPPRSVWPWVLGAVALGALVALALWWRSRLARRPVPEREVPRVPPDVLALGRIKELARMLDRAEIGGERLVVEVSGALRRWLQDGLGLHALEQTSEEFLQDLQTSAVLPKGFRLPLSAFLEQCDLVKFAAQHPGVEQCRGLLDSARDFVLATRDQEPESARAGR